MTCNFKNSAGTDLDNLFYSDNGNAGALGFKNSSGTDLGNKYTSKSTLGTTVGYKNSAGTDMGNLRGATVPPTISSSTSQSLSTSCYTISSGGDSSYDSYYASSSVCLKFTSNQTITSIKATLYVTKYSDGAGVSTTSSVRLYSSGCTSGLVSSSYLSATYSSTGNWSYTTSGLSLTTVYVLINAGEGTHTGSGSWSVSLYVTLQFTSSSGSTTYTSSTYSPSATCGSSGGGDSGGSGGV